MKYCTKRMKLIAALSANPDKSVMSHPTSEIVVRILMSTPTRFNVIVITMK